MIKGNELPHCLDRLLLAYYTHALQPDSEVQKGHELPVPCLLVDRDTGSLRLYPGIAAGGLELLLHASVQHVVQVPSS